MPALRRTCTALLVSAVLAAGTTALAGPASAAPPVTVDDNVTMYAGGVRTVDVLANDSDADGKDTLTICRLGDNVETAHYVVGIEDGKLFVATDPGVTGQITITYYACDYETLTPGTLTISFKKVYPIRVTKLRRPGLLRVTNRNDRQVRFLWGSFKADNADGRTVVAPHDSTVVRVHRHRIDWVAMIGREALVGMGHVRNIALPRNDRPQASRVALDRADAKAWAGARG